MKMQIFRCEIRESETNRIIENLGFFDTEQEAEDSAAAWFVSRPGEGDWCEFQIVKVSAEATTYENEDFHIDPDYGEARPGERGYMHPDHEGKEPMKWED